MSNQFISVQQEDFDIRAESEQLRISADNPGAIVTFCGLVREIHPGQEGGEEGDSEELFLEHYPGMTEKCLEDIAEQAAQRWEISACRVIHRVGSLKPGEQIVYVGTASAHRHAAFESAEFIMDYLKTKAPFWKRQTDADGSHWVEHRTSDDVAANRWKKQA